MVGTAITVQEEDRFVDVSIRAQYQPKLRFDSFNVDQGVAQGCSLSPILFSVFINDLLKEVEQAELGIQLSSGKTFGGMLFADDFVYRC